MHDKADVVDVDAAGRYIGRYQDAGLASRECGKRTLPLVLVQVAVDGGRIDSGPVELP